MPKANLGELVEYSQDSAYLILKVPKTQQPVKPFGLKEAGANADGTTIYEVPKSDIYAYYAADLADGSVITLMRRKEIPYARRLELYEAAIAKGLDCRPVEESKKRGKKAALTLEELTKAGMKPTGTAKKNAVSNSL